MGTLPQNAGEAQTSLRGQLGKQKQMLEMLDKAETDKRSAAAQVQECWSAVLRVCEVLNEEGRAELLGSFMPKGRGRGLKRYREARRD